jgi:hypothetical protein
MMNDSQMELGLAEGPAFTGRIQPPHRRGRARWWFERMRRIVDEAFDWQAVPEPPPRQTWFENGYRQPSPGDQGGSAGDRPANTEDQRQICE